MIKITEKGQARIDIEKFHENILCLTDVPMDLLDACINFLKDNKPQTITCNCKEHYFILVIDNSGVYILRFKDRPKVYNFETPVLDFIKNVFEDINSSMLDWTDRFYTGINQFENIHDMYKIILKTKVMELHDLLKPFEIF